MESDRIKQSELQQFGNLEFIAKQVVEGFITGLHKSPFHGFSVEFAEHRPYNSGESTKHVDWKLFGKTDKLFIKKYEEETNLRCHIIIDNSSSMYFPLIEELSLTNLNKIWFSVYSAAALINLLRQQRDACGLSIFTDKINVHTPCKSTFVHQNFLYSELEKLLPPISTERTENTAIAETIHEIAEKIHKRSLVIIFSDMMDNISKSEDVFSSLQHLRHNRHEVILFHVTDKKTEYDFEYSNRPHRFIDLENETEVKVNPSEIKDLYISRLKEFKTNLKLKCGQYKIDFVESDINEGFNNILYKYLAKREKLL